jgi:hypothetical protein
MSLLSESQLYVSMTLSARTEPVTFVVCFGRTESLDQIVLSIGVKLFESGHGRVSMLELS